MKNTPSKIFLFAATLCLLSGCKDPAPEPVNQPPTPIANNALADEPQATLDDSAAAWISCPDQRPEMCAQMYLPVCGAIDTGVRCVTTPCPSTKYKTFGNACTACAETTVIQYRKGECTKPYVSDDAEDN